MTLDLPMISWIGHQKCKQLMQKMTNATTLSSEISTLQRKKQ